MLPVERRKWIMEQVEERKTMKIGELSERLGVSEMTVHRDIKPLIEEGFIVKTFGGISLCHEMKTKDVQSQECVYCHRPINQRLAYRLILKNNRIETACCAHCGLLRQRQLDKEVLQAICPDFLLQTTISAASAWFVFDTTLHLGCCQPQVLAFEHKRHAEQFIQGFGGKIHPFAEASTLLVEKMDGDSCGCGTVQ